MPDLVEPSLLLREAFLTAHREWGPGTHEDGFGIGPGDEVDTVEGFTAWVQGLRTAADAGRATSWWIVERGRVLGAVALRHEDGDRTRQVGHVGYGIRPSARGRGMATWALGEVLARARAAGVDRLLVVCEDDNAASARVVERCGGELEEVYVDGGVRLRRYRVATGGPPSSGGSSQPART